MNAESNDLSFKGCTPVPLAHYLKGLGIFRIVAEQADPRAKGYWQEDSFHLETALDNDSLKAFFLERYSPTPVVAPWNGGSGFYFQEEKLKEKDPLTGKRKKTGRRTQPTAATKAVQDILESTASRLSSYRESLKITKNLVMEMGLEEAPSKEMKEDLIQAVRNSLSDSAISWLDASVILTTENAKFPPLLGTGGNDGNLDFSSNFMQRLKDIIEFSSGKAIGSSKEWLEGALFAVNTDSLVSGISIGQFYPGAVGGPNSASGFSSDSQVNPWDYVLMIEGLLFFASAAVKRLQAKTPGVLSYPFSVHSSGVGYGSASESDEKNSRAEIWMPIWDRPAGLLELRALMGEGRAQVGARPARNGVDFARAVATLGVDRGLKSFQRYSFLERNGRNFLAVPLEQVMVSRQPQVELLAEVDSWLLSFYDNGRREKAPASISRALRILESSIMALCKERSNKNENAWRVQDVLIALGECEKAIVRSSHWAKEYHVHPVSPLGERWLLMADDQSLEFRLASSLASVYRYSENKDSQELQMPLRAQLEPVRRIMKGRHPIFIFDETLERDAISSEGDPVSVMNSIFSRRIMATVRSGKNCHLDRGVIEASLGDIAAFIEGRVNLKHMMDLLWGLILVDWQSIPKNLINWTPETILPSASFALLKLCFAGGAVHDVEIPLVPQIHRRAAIGDSFNALKLAERRLRGSNLPIAEINSSISSTKMKRIAAALLFPIGDERIEDLATLVFRPSIDLETNLTRSEERSE